MNKLRKKHLSTLHTARLISNVMLLVGFLILPAALMWFEYLAITEGEPIGEILQEPAMSIFSKTAWLIIAAIVSTVVVWAGYMLKTIVVLAETQLHDTAPA